MSLYDSKRHAGYSQEEAYFHKVNQELIEKMKEKKQHLKLVVSNPDPQQTRSQQGDQSFASETGSSPPRKRAA